MKVLFVFLIQLLLSTAAFSSDSCDSRLNKSLSGSSNPTENSSKMLKDIIAAVARFLPKNGTISAENAPIKSIPNAPKFTTSTLIQLAELGITIRPAFNGLPDKLRYTLVIQNEKSREFIHHLLSKIQNNTFRSMLVDDWGGVFHGILLINALVDSHPLAQKQIPSETLFLEPIYLDQGVNRTVVRTPPGWYLITFPALDKSLSSSNGYAYFQENTPEISILTQRIKDYLVGGSDLEKLELKLRFFTRLPSDNLENIRTYLNYLNEWINTDIFNARNFQEFYYYLIKLDRKNNLNTTLIKQVHKKIDVLANEMLTSTDAHIRKNVTTVAINSTSSVFGKQHTLQRYEFLSSLLTTETNSENLKFILESIHIRPWELQWKLKDRFDQSVFNQEFITANLILNRMKPHKDLIPLTHFEWIRNDLNLERLGQNLRSFRIQSDYAPIFALKLLKENLDLFKIDDSHYRYLIIRFKDLEEMFLDEQTKLKRMSDTASFVYQQFNNEITQEQLNKELEKILRLPVVYDESKIAQNPLLFQEMNEIRPILDIIAAEKWAE